MTAEQQNNPQKQGNPSPQGNPRKQGSALITVLSILLFGGMLGVLLLLLFGNRNPGADTVSATTPGIPGTTLSQPASSNAATSNAATSGAASTASNATTAPDSHTPVEGEAASGSPGQQQATPAATDAASSADTASSGSNLELEQTVTGTDFKGTGKEIYVQACQACHMPGGVGAKGGGGMYNYPALADNPKLKTAQYPISMVLFGNGGMPSFGHYMNDEQITEVVNYIRTELNKNTDKIKPADVKQMRQPGQHYMIFGEAAG